MEDLPAWAPLLPAATAALFVALLVQRPWSISVPETFPVTATKLIAASGFSGNLVQRFDWGEYLIWKLSPQTKVMMDGRRETVYPNSVYQAYLHFQSGRGDWQEILRLYPSDLALLDTTSSTVNLMRLLPDWRLVYEDETAVILARAGSTAESQLTNAVQKLSSTSGAPISKASFP
jgi:hypothetical protein